MREVPIFRMSGHSKIILYNKILTLFYIHIPKTIKELRDVIPVIPQSSSIYNSNFIALKLFRFNRDIEIANSLFAMR